MATAPMDSTMMANPPDPVYGQLAPPEDPFNPTPRDGIATPYTMMLEATDTVLQSRGGITNLAIYRELLRDDQVEAAWQQRRLALTRCETYVEPGGDDALSKAAAEQLQAELDAMAWDDITDKVLFAIFYGWGVAEVMWRPDGARVAFDRIIVRDRARFRFDRQGVLYLYENGWHVMPPSKFWTIRSGADNHDELYGLGLAHRLYWPVFFKRNDIRFWLTFLEKFGMPTAVAKLPAGKMADAKEVAKATAMLRMIATDAGIVVPDDVVVELLEAARSGAADYGAMHDAMNGAISKIIVGQTMTTDDGSSRAQGEVHERVAQKIVEADADLLCGTFNAGPVAYWTAWNFPGAKAPRVFRRTEPPADLKSLAETDTAVSALGYEADESYIQETYGAHWRKKQAPAVDPMAGLGIPGERPGNADPAQFAESELAALAALKAARRGDQQALAEAATAFAAQYETVMARRVAQVIEAADFAEDPQLFRDRLDEILAEVPPPETVDKLTRGSLFARMMGALRAQRRA